MDLMALLMAIFEWQFGFWLMIDVSIPSRIWGDYDQPSMAYHLTLINWFKLNAPCATQFNSVIFGMKCHISSKVQN